jgi:hypothetical protein
MLELDLSADVAGQACRRAISDLGWRVLEDEGARLVVKEVSPQTTSFTWSAKIEVAIQENGSSSEILLNGSITGMGPIQKGHLRGQVGALKNKIALEAQDASADSKSAPGSDEISGELERLAGLHKDGVLTDQEFARAKARLLGLD